MGAHYQYPVSLEEIDMDLEKYNPNDGKTRMISTPNTQSSAKENKQMPENSTWNIPKAKFRNVSPIHYQNQFDLMPTPTKIYQN